MIPKKETSLAVAMQGSGDSVQSNLAGKQSLPEGITIRNRRHCMQHRETLELPLTPAWSCHSDGGSVSPQDSLKSGAS